MEMSSTVPMTAWQSGRFRAARAGSRKLLFGCMYEDAEIELRAFQPDGRIFCIASAGCTAMKLAAHHAVVAVDINPVQLAYVQERLGGGCHSARQRRTHSRFCAHARASRRMEQTKGASIPRSRRSGGTNPLLAAPSGYAPISCRFFFFVLARRSSFGLLRCISQVSAAKFRN